MSFDSQPSPDDYRSLGGEVTPAANGLRLDAYLARQFPFLGRQRWRELCDRGEVVVSGRPRKRTYRLQAGEVISYYFPAAKEPAVDRGVTVIYRDDDVLVACKPPDLPMHEGSYFRKNTFAEVIKDVAGSEWAATHRIDRATSGIVVCGSNYHSRAHLCQQFLERTIAKEYLFLTAHEPPAKQWLVDTPIATSRVDDRWTRYWISNVGAPALTGFAVEAVRGRLALIRAFPKTGRTLQIRIHAAASGVPLLGDELCQPGVSWFARYKAEGACARMTAALGHDRACLHAAAITFLHPTRQEYMRITCPLYGDMQSLWGQS